MTNFGKLPNFFIIGAAKSGTTTLYDLLRQHPQVYLPRIKEPMFFNREEHFARGVEWYEEMFFKGAERYPARGEATPHYLYWSGKVAPRIKELYGDRDVKFIVSFRDPVKRAYSWYWNMVREGREDLAFAEAISAEGERLATHRRSLDEQGSMVYGHFEGGRYAGQLRPFLELFPKENFLFLLQEDLNKDPYAVASEAFAFLGVDSSVRVRQANSNLATMPRMRAVHRLLRERSAAKELIKPLIPLPVRSRIVSGVMRLNLKRTSYPPMDKSSESDLRRRYREEVQQLQKIVGRDLSHWT